MKIRRNIYIDDEIYEKGKKIAKMQGRSFSNMIERYILEEYDYNTVGNTEIYQKINPIEQQEYLECHDLQGNWWYKDLRTGKDLTIGVMPIKENK